MLIKSQFKDYYDYVAHLHGGGDPSIVYDRKRLAPLHITNCLAYPPGLEVNFSTQRKLGTSYGLEGLDNRYLCVCGKYFLLIKVKDTSNQGFHYEVLDEVRHPKVVEALTTRKRRGVSRAPKSFGYYVGCFEQDLVELSKLISAPVFMLYGYVMQSDGTRKLRIESEVPILSNITGFASIYHATQLYQDLSYFIGNLMHDSPDLMKPSVVTDKDKVQSHGFDVVQSFRHRPL